VAWTPTTAGQRSLTARATDDGGAQTTSSAVGVDVAEQPNSPPQVIAYGPSAATVGVGVTLTATAADDGTVTLIEFFDGATPIGSDATGPYSINWTPASTGVHSITARATDNLGAQTTSAAVNVTVNVAAQGGGLSASYFANEAMSGSPVLSRVEAVDFTWAVSTGTASPGPGVPEDHWSARWTGSIELPTDGAYLFEFVADDGARVWLNGVQLADKWTNGGTASYYSASITASAGTRLSVVFEHYDGSGNSTARIRWKTPTLPQYWVSVPASRLYTN
jgi:hypothetical protein